MTTQRKIDVNEFASLVTIYISVLTVIYSNGNYDSWDVLISGLIIFSIYRFKENLQNSNVAKWFSRIALSIAFTVILFFVESFSSPYENWEFKNCKALANKGFLNTLRIFYHNILGCEDYEIFDFEFIIAMMMFVILSMAIGIGELIKRKS